MPAPSEHAYFTRQLTVRSLESQTKVLVQDFTQFGGGGDFLQKCSGNNSNRDTVMNARCNLPIYMVLV